MKRLVSFGLILSTLALAGCSGESSSPNSSSSFTQIKPADDGSVVLSNFLKVKHGEVKAWVKDNIFIERFFDPSRFKNYGFIQAGPQKYFQNKSNEDLSAPYIVYRCQKGAGDYEHSQIGDVWKIERGGDYQRYIKIAKPKDKSWLYAVIKVDGNYIGMKTLDTPGKHKFIGYNNDPKIYKWKDRFGGKAPFGLDNSLAFDNAGVKKLSDIISKASKIELTAGDGNQMFYAKFEFDPPLAERDISGMCEFATSDKLIPGF